MQSHEPLSTTDTSARSRRLPGAIRRWSSVTVHLQGWLLAEFTRLARELGQSRIALIRECLEFAGLPHARALAAKKRREADASAIASADAHAAPSAPAA